MACSTEDLKTTPTFPVIRAICTGRICKSTHPSSRDAHQYAVTPAKKTKEPAAYALYSRPLHNACVLGLANDMANEPTEGDTANCVYQTVDVNIDMTPTALHSQRHPRAAKEGTLQTLAGGARVDRTARTVARGVCTVLPPGS
jgi:hypothetical protein